MLMPNQLDKITRHPLQESNPTKAIDDPEIKAWIALGRTKSKKNGGGKKERSPDLFVQYIYQYIAVIHLLESQSII